MFNRSKVLLLCTLTLCVLIVAVGCDQPEDVITPTNSAYLTLNPERLPNNPAGTVYELWVADTLGDTMSLGRFGYDYALRHFLTTDANPIVRDEGGKFFIDESIDNYNTIIVSVEPTIGDIVESPATVMLVDYISSPTIKLLFPMSDSLWDATARYNMRATSTGNQTNLNDGSAIWFCSYEQSVRTITDTFSIIEWKLDSSEFVDSSTVTPRVNVIGIDTTTIVTFDTIQVLGANPDNGVGLDTIFDRTVVRFETILSYDSLWYYPTTLKVTYDTASYDVIEEKYTQDAFEIPNLQKFGWKYRGWVVSDLISPAATGSMTKPAWTFFNPILTNTDGGLLTTGVFYDIAIPDQENPFVNTTFKNPPRVPPYPGEDFLENLPAALGSVPNLAGGGGHVFISIEPEFYNESTNFPLVAYSTDLPLFSDSASSTTQGHTLTCYTYTNDDLRGFPKISVTIERF